MRSPDDDLLQPVTGCCTLLQLLLWCEHLDRAFLARSKQDHALQTPQAEWTNVIAERETVLIFGYRHRLAARRENIPYKILLCRIFSSSNWKRTQHTRNGFSNLVNAICSLPADVRNGSWSCKNAIAREAGEKPGPDRHQATIAANSGLVPMMFMTRVRL
jgi:hypothetical protein